jgi:hypothetical protein
MSEPQEYGLMRRLSRASTASTFNQKTDCIAYNYATRKLSKESKAKVEGLYRFCNVKVTNTDHITGESHIEVQIPDHGRWCEILLPVKGSSAKYYIATVDLGRLGRSVRTKRQQGTIKSLFVVGKSM